jgi:hypothetical protein
VNATLPGDLPIVELFALWVMGAADEEAELPRENDSATEYAPASTLTACSQLLETSFGADKITNSDDRELYFCCGKSSQSLRKTSLLCCKDLR